MGRRIHLERLVLGRSAFEELEAQDDEGPRLDGQEHAPPGTHQGGEHESEYVQQYDNKGRPTNPGTDKIKQQQRHAQNAILELVGVVERKERGASEMYRNISKAREQLLTRENERGEDLELAELTISSALTWFPQALMARIQAGIYSFFMPFTDVLLLELSRAGGGWKMALATLLPGLVAVGVSGTAELMLYEGANYTISQIETLVMRRARREQLPLVESATKVAREVVFSTIDVLLLPLKYHGYAQMLGIAPFYPLLPPAWPVPMSWLTSSPTQTPSYHLFIWSPLLTHGPLRYISSPAILMLGLSLITRRLDANSPIAAQFTTFKYPAVNAGARLGAKAHKHDFLRPFFLHAYEARRTVMRWLGYPLQSGYHAKLADGRPNELHSNVILDATHSGTKTERYHLWRSTALALMPAQFLAGKIDGFFARVLTLGLESTVFPGDNVVVPRSTGAAEDDARVQCGEQLLRLDFVWRTAGAVRGVDVWEKIFEQIRLEHCVVLYGRDCRILCRVRIGTMAGTKLF